MRVVKGEQIAVRFSLAPRVTILTLLRTTRLSPSTATIRRKGGTLVPVILEEQHMSSPKHQSMGSASFQHDIEEEEMKKWDIALTEEIRVRVSNRILKKRK
ncbi:hypothetical protein GH714_019076 [Hevea brasiliensis]|uniref:Uncharacterized protein n=1 Tax=Hevea brasiliensis TaxID=3981 RepID=A0A6A6KXZ0_HEVBR|nr:hypothetical protein GH714_019076 [Hevea brasiliensis]